MRSKSVLAHAILAVGGMVLAYLTWTDDGPAVSEEEVVLFECDPDAVTRVELHLSEEDISLEVERSGDAPQVWLTSNRHPENGEPSTMRFVGSEEAVEYLEQVAPFAARRSLGELTDELLAEVGLDDAERTITLHCGERTASFELGERAYGEGDRYLRASTGGPAYLVATARLQPLEAARVRLMQRALHTFEWTEVETMSVEGFGASRRLRQRNRLDARTSEWVDAADPDRRNELFGNWFGRYPRIRVQSYLAADASPGADLEDTAGQPEAIMTVRFMGEDESELGRMEMQRVAGATPAFYVRTETTRGWVRIPTSVAQPFADEVRPVLGLEPVDAQPTPTDGAANEPAPTETPASEDASPSETAPPPPPASTGAEGAQPSSAG